MFVDEAAYDAGYESGARDTRDECVKEAELWPRIFTDEQMKKTYADGFRDALAEVKKTLENGPYL